MAVAAVMRNTDVVAMGDYMRTNRKISIRGLHNFSCKVYTTNQRVDASNAALFCRRKTILVVNARKFDSNEYVACSQVVNWELFDSSCPFIVNLSYKKCHVVGVHLAAPLNRRKNFLRCVCSLDQAFAMCIPNIIM